MGRPTQIMRRPIFQPRVKPAIRLQIGHRRPGIMTVSISGFIPATTTGNGLFVLTAIPIPQTTRHLNVSIAMNILRNRKPTAIIRVSQTISTRALLATDVTQEYSGKYDENGLIFLHAYDSNGCFTGGWFTPDHVRSKIYFGRGSISGRGRR